MMLADGLIRASTAAVVVGVASVAAFVSYQHAYEVVRSHGEGPVTARLVPFTVDGLVYASSMVLLHSARHRLGVPGLARLLLGLGIAATLAANVAHGAGHGPVGALVAAWPAVALVGAYELLMSLVRTRAEARAPASIGRDNPLAHARSIDPRCLDLDAVESTGNGSRATAVARDRPSRWGSGSGHHRSIDDLRVELNAAIEAGSINVEDASAEAIRTTLRCSPARARRLRDELAARVAARTTDTHGQDRTRPHLVATDAREETR